MMTSLLSIFDPSYSTYLSNWVFLMLFFIFPKILINFWKSSSVMQFFMKKLVVTIILLFKSKFKTELFFSTLFMFILFINLSGLIPYSFSLSSHFSFNFSIGFSLWITSLIWGFSKNWSQSLSHLTPSGCPMMLMPFMVLVEMISLIIRPVTVSLRLMANLMAGHMILLLICSAFCSFEFIVFKCFFIFFNFLFFMFELGVAFIQAYVFSMLLSLYWKENE